VHFRERDGKLVARPRRQDRLAEGIAVLAEDPHELDVGVRDTAVPAMGPRRVALQAVIQESIARGVVVNAQQVRRLRVRSQGVEVAAARTGRLEPAPERVRPVQAPGESVEDGPAPIAVERCLRRQLGRRARVADVLRGHDERVAAHRADRPGCGADC
jgi:hypothetical protein